MNLYPHLVIGNSYSEMGVLILNNAYTEILRYLSKNPLPIDYCLVKGQQ